MLAIENRLRYLAISLNTNDLYDIDTDKEKPYLNAIPDDLLTMTKSLLPQNYKSLLKLILSALFNDQNVLSQLHVVKEQVEEIRKTSRLKLIKKYVIERALETSVLFFKKPTNQPQNPANRILKESNLNPLNKPRNCSTSTPARKLPKQSGFPSNIPAHLQK